RGRSRRQGRAGRLRPRHGRQRVAGFQPEHVRQAGLRSGQGFRSDCADFRRGERPRRPERGARKNLAGARRARPRPARQAHLCARRRGHVAQHLAAELFKSMARLDIQPVAYRGTTALLPDLLAGRVTMSFGNLVYILPLVRHGKLRAFAVTSVKRSGLAPDLPTMAESGYPGFEAVPWFGLMAQSETSPAIVDKLYRETVKILAAPDIRKS